jgi:hypothetical protein
LKNVPPVQLKTVQGSNVSPRLCPKNCTQLVGANPVCKTVPAQQIASVARNLFFVFDIQGTPIRKPISASTRALQLYRFPK